MHPNDNLAENRKATSYFNSNSQAFFFFFFFLNNFIYKTIIYTTYSINYTYIVLATYTTDTYTYTNYAYTTLRYMYYNTIVINLIYGWRVYKVLFNSKTIIQLVDSPITNNEINLPVYQWSNLIFHKNVSHERLIKVQSTKIASN